MWAGEALERAFSSEGRAWSAKEGQGENSAMNPAIIGGLVVGVSLVAAAILCTGLCLALWYKRLRGQAGDPSPATFLVSKQRKPDQYASPEHPMAFVMPTITASEAGSEPQTPTPTQILTPTERSKAIAKSGGSNSSTFSQPRSNPPNPEDHPNVQRWDALMTARQTPPPAYSPPPPACRSQGFCTSPSYYPVQSNLRPRSASPKGGLKPLQCNPPHSLPIASNRWTPRSAKRPRSASPKVLKPAPVSPPALPPRLYQAMDSRVPPALPPRSIFFRRGAGFTEEIRVSSQHQHYLDEEYHRSNPDIADVTTPDSVDSWGPTWTPASSIASGGGCGLGELQVRLRYSMRTRLLRLTVLSADNLPLRLGPDPVDTYTKAVLLPDKRVRFSTRMVPAMRNAHFHASFTHAARPSRLAHSSLRFSVCQVTSCGRRVVLGYAALTLSSAGLRAGLNHDIDTGSLTLHLQESAPDQQVGMGGQLQIGLSWDNDAHELTISILHLLGLQYDQNTMSEEVQVYVKVTVYTNNTILCWRRTTPRTMESEVTLFEEELILRMPELDLDATHLVLSARERTGPGCGRRVLGSCVVGRGSCVGEEGRHQWLDMLRAAPDIVVRTHPLAPLAPYQYPAAQQIPPAYQNVFPGPSSHDPDLPAYHRYQNIGLISSQSFPVVEIPGPHKDEEDTVQSEESQDQDEPSDDEGHCSDQPTPEQCQSPDTVTDDCQDTEMTSLSGSHHSGLLSSDQSHYSELSSPIQMQQEDGSSGEQSSEAVLTQQESEDSESIKYESSVKEVAETLYHNQPIESQPKYATPKTPSEPIYAKPNLTLKRNNLNRQSSSDTFSNISTMSHPSYRSSYQSSEHIYDSPDISMDHIYDKIELPGKHIYDKPATLPQNVYQNVNLPPRGNHYASSLQYSHTYQHPSQSPPHIYESPDLSPEHIYQIPYGTSLRRYQNIDYLIQVPKSDYQNVTTLMKKDQIKHAYENVHYATEESAVDLKTAEVTEIPVKEESQEHGRKTETLNRAQDIHRYENLPIDEGEVSEQRLSKVTKYTAEDESDDQEEFISIEYQGNCPQPGSKVNTGDNGSDTSEVFHDARSSTQSYNEAL